MTPSLPSHALILTAAAAAKSHQSCLTMWDPTESSPQAPLSMGFSRQEYCSGLPFPSPNAYSYALYQPGKSEIVKPLDVPALDPSKGSSSTFLFLRLPTSPALPCGPWVMPFVLQDLCVIYLVSETSRMVFDEVHPAIIIRTTRSGSTTNLVFMGEINCGDSYQQDGPGECLMHF